MWVLLRLPQLQAHFFQLAVQWQLNYCLAKMVVYQFSTQVNSLKWLPEKYYIQKQCWMPSQCFFFFDEDEVPSGLDVSKIFMDEEAHLNPAGETYSVTFSQKVLLLTLNLKNSIYMSFKDAFFRTLTFKITKWKVIHKRTGNNKIRKKIRSYFKKLILAYRFRLIHLRVKDFQGMVTMLLRFLIVLCSYQPNK